MGFDCANINSVFMNMVSGALQDSSFAGQEKGLPRDTVFSRKLGRMLEQAENRLPGSLDGTRAGTRKQLDDLAGQLAEAGESGFLSKLKSFLSGRSPDSLQEMTINAEGLAALEALLLQAGFDSGAVTELMTELYDKLAESTLTIQDCFGALASMMDDSGMAAEGDPQDSDLEAGSWLPVSAVPYIESLMSMMAISPRDRESILADAVDNRQGVNLDQLIKNLHSFQKHAFLSGNEPVLSGTFDQLQMLASGLGLDVSSESQQSFTLSDLISAFESLRDRLVDMASGAAEPGTSSKNSALNSLNSEKTEEIRQMLALMMANIRQSNAGTGAAGLQEAQSPANSAAKAALIAGQGPGMNIGVNRQGADSSILSNSSSKNDPAGSVSKNDPSGFSSTKSLFGQIQVPEPSAGKAGEDTALRARDLETMLAKPEKSLLSKNSDINPLSGKGAGSMESRFGSAESAARPAARDLPAHVARQVGRSLVRAVNQGVSELRIQLKPPELGRMTMVIDHVGSSIKVNIMTEHQGTREMLMSTATELRTALSSAGINLESFEVDLGSEFRQSMADARNQADQFAKNNKNRKTRPGADDGLPVQGSAGRESLNTVNADGHLHYVA